MPAGATKIALDARPSVALLRPGAPVPESQAGGKGAALDRLVQEGFPVPPAAIITAGAYRAVAGHPALAKLLDAISAGTPVAAGAVDEAFLAVPIPDPVAAEITSVARLVGDGGPVAIRSSATVEDMASASFAGQYRSSLDVQGDGDVLRAVRLTWASLWHPAPCAYRQSWGIASEGIAMAVVVMRMVPAQQAGVTFTVDPAGAAGRVRVEAVAGPGEALVSGERTPDVWLVPRDEAVRNEPTPAHILCAADLALRVERAFGAPQDVEWAWDGTRVWLVQARPITVGTADQGDACETAPDASELTTSGIAEMLPGVIAPLPWDVNSFLVEEALRTVFGQLGALPDLGGGRHEFIRRVHGRAAMNLDLITAAAAVSGGSAAEVERQYFGGSVDPPAQQAPPQRGWRLTPQRGWRLTLRSLRAAAVRRQAVVEAEIVLAAAAEIVAARAELPDLDDRQLLAYRRRLIALGARAMAVELAVAAAAVAAYQQLEAFLTPHLGAREAASTVQRVTVGAGSPRPYVESMSRSIFGGPTWAEVGTPLPAHRSRRAEREPARRELERHLRSKPSWRRIRILTGQIVDVRMHILRRLVHDATEGLTRRERIKAAVLLLGGEVRRVHLELGRRLVHRRALAESSDVDLLRDSELPDALRMSGPPPAELARRRRWLHRWQDEGPLPARFTGSPDRQQVAVPTGDRLSGWAASPGRHTGRARVVSDPADDRLAAGEVLVAAMTDAGWSPLFLRAGAIVVERGGPLSHAAIVARELGVPAVLNVTGATGVLDGELVTVDGDDGVVVVHREPGGGR